MSESLPLSGWVAPHLFLEWDLNHPSAWVEHAPFLAWLLGEHRPRRFVELGTHWGFSYFAALRVAQFLDLDLTAMAVDTWEGEAHAGEYAQDVFDYVTRVNDAEHSGHSRLYRGTFDDAAGATPDGSVDLLHIDGLHTYEASSHDFRTWLPKLSDRGVVLFHDVAERKEDFGVYRTWDEVRGSYPSFTFEHGHGLGVLLVGSHVGESVRWLAERGADGEGDAVRLLFSALGHDVSMQLGLEVVAEVLDGTLAGGRRRADARSAFLGEAERLRPLIIRQAQLLEGRDEILVQLARVEAERDASGRQVTALEEALSESRAALDSLLASRSWRLTRGVRAVSHLPSRLTRG